MLKICGTALRAKALLASAYPREWLLPSTDERVSFEEDIKPLFRPMDYESMAWAFDLGRTNPEASRVRTPRGSADRTETGLPAHPALLVLLWEPRRIIALAVGPG
jgi:hypothetical protein